MSAQPAAPVPFQPLVVTGVGAISPVGDCAAQTCTSIRAGVNGFRDHEYYWGQALYPEWQFEEPVKVAPVASLDPMLDGPERLMQLALPALRELSDAAELRRAELARSALLVALPAPDDVVTDWGLEDFGETLAARTGLPVAQTVVEPSGHCAALRQLAQASALLQSPEIEQCILVAVDSYLSFDRLALLDANWRLRSPRNADGFIPGEAAVALRLEMPNHAARRGAKIALDISALGFGAEPNAFGCDRSSTGTGLCDAIRGVWPESPPCRWVLCDFNGESYRAFEWGIAQTRLGERLPSPRTQVRPVDSCGDTGAAAAGVLLACAAAAFARGYAAAERALLWTSSDAGVRAAAVVSARNGS